MGNTPSALEDRAARAKPTRRRTSSGRREKRSSSGLSNPKENSSDTRDSSPEAVVTVHRPGHLYSHSINLPSGSAGAQESTENVSPTHSRHHHHNTWDYAERPGVVLAGASYTRAAGSDMSLVDPASDRDDSSAQYSDSVHGSITSDSEAEHVSDNDQSHVPNYTQRAQFRFPRIQTDTEGIDVEPAMKTPRASAPDMPLTPRMSGSELQEELDSQRTPQQRNEGFGSRINIPHRASLIIGDDTLTAMPEPAPSTDEISASSDFTQTESENSQYGKRRLRAFPSYLKIPTAIPRSYTSSTNIPAATEQQPVGTPNSLDILNMPMYSGTTTGSSDVHVEQPTADAPVIPIRLTRTHTAPQLVTRVPLEAEAKAGSDTEAPAAPEKVLQREMAPVETEAAKESTDDAPLLTPVNIMWRGKGKKVYVTGTFADEWRSKIPLRQLRPNTPFLCTLYLPPGTHRLKFVVDDRWRISNELNTASDGDGTLVNYVEIPNSREGYQDTALAPHAKTDNTDLKPADDPRFADPAWASAMDDLRKQQRAYAEHQRGGEWDVLGDDIPGAEVAHWTSEVPPAVEVAQETEEALHDNEMAADAPALLPTPPILPRQLEKVILNSSPANAMGGINTAAALVDDNSVLPAPNHAVLHHLAASAIKNGVLAIGTVTRYKRKYVTTLLYRPV